MSFWEICRIDCWLQRKANLQNDIGLIKSLSAAECASLKFRNYKFKAMKGTLTIGPSVIANQKMDRPFIASSAANYNATMKLEPVIGRLLN